VKIQPKAVELIDVENQLKAKNIEVSDLDRKIEAIKAANIEKDAKAAQKDKKIYKSDEVGLDMESSFTVLFDDIIEMAKYNGIKIYSIEYIYDPAEDEVVKAATGKYNVCQLNIQMIADYVDMESFFKEIYKYPYLVNIDNIEIVPYEKNKKLLLTKLKLKLYSAK
jgi:Tfp pilus assembly protein PilO